MFKRPRFLLLVATPSRLARRVTLAAAMAAALMTQPVGAQTSGGPGASVPTPAAAQSQDIRTRHAHFKASRFDELPGWTQDNLDTAWDAFAASCQSLAKRETWKPLCAQAATLTGSPTRWRSFFEQGFTLFRILNTDTSPDGEVTGYYEPVINGSSRAQGAFQVPIYATPNDLYTLDWKTIPAAQRGSTVWVVKAGRSLKLVPTANVDSYALDTRNFDLDARDRSWRVQLLGKQAQPYRSRSEIEALGRLDAPVIAYVDDALALYAMQMQGSGRIRLTDGSQLRLQYAEQNGHPFKPLRLVSKNPERGRTRSIESVTEGAESFELADTSDSVPTAEAEQTTEQTAEQTAEGTAEGIRRRGLKAGERNLAGDGAVTEALVEQLLRQSQRAPGPAAAVRSPAPVHPAAAATAPATDREVPTARGLPALNSDPSYVFFRVASDQSPALGPVGALGVPLTAGRSIAVDPRVTPLGYPVYISAPAPAGAAPPLHRLVVAQDTGGAIRGAIRADFFWGSGQDAGRQALRTRHRAAMWLMLPHAEAAELRQRAVTTRLIGGPLRLDRECLVADDISCSEPD